MNSSESEDPRSEISDPGKGGWRATRRVLEGLREPENPRRSWRLLLLAGVALVLLSVGVVLFLRGEDPVPPVPPEVDEQMVLADPILSRLQERMLNGDHRNVIGDLTEAIEKYPRCAILYFDRGHARWKMGDRAGARRDYEKALELAPAGWPHEERARAALQETAAE